jgi:4-coumarate--CoA ligase
MVLLHRFQVSPTELEEILVRHPQVDSAAVVGIWSDAAASELPRAYVVLNSPPRSDVAAKNLSGEIEDFVAKLVANYKRLRGGVVFLDALPKNSTGKVLRRALRNEKPLIAPRVAVKL